MALCCAGCDDLECEDCTCAMEVHYDVCPGRECEVCLARVENSKRLRRQRVVGHWQSAFAKLVHKEKSKAFLADIHQCGFEVGEVLRQQLKAFNKWHNAWYYEWGTGFPRRDEANDERAAFLSMGEDNPYYLDWLERNDTGEPAVLHPFCHVCALCHGKVSWCN